ncbi:hypothetical protein SISNIDRAFT_511420 [Sistotremastrum niveocremeum HHB9708]|uniref:Thioredoxin-like fold domain-containing protein n=1 Tax=Sistotremastrum niveocremeum HHB9708 TaxID=1314777 RepID=A0A164T5D9_9AGAM|nr:hypothetical protein SISNIDRAFT_511420 [Sistotremastrum niveocremeum HHB9708]
MVSPPPLPSHSSPSSSSETEHITLYGFYKPENKPSASGFCQKLETFFRAVGYTSYTHTATWPNKAPKGKLPYISITPSSSSPDDKDLSKSITILPDSTFIIKHLIESGITPDPDSLLTPLQKADSRAYQAQLEEFTYHALVCSRWRRPANYTNIVRDLPIPWPFNLFIPGYIRRGILASIVAQGVGRHSDEEQDGIMKELIDALELKYTASAALLSSAVWFHATDTPTLIDITIAGFFMNALGYDTNPEFASMILASPRLREFAKVTTKMWFPEYEGVLKVIAEAELAQGAAA